MSGSRRIWTKEQREAQRERLAQRRKSPKFEANRVAAMRTPEYVEGARERMRIRRNEPAFAAKQAASSLRPAVKAKRRLAVSIDGDDVLWSKKRGGRVPHGYENLYRSLMRKMKGKITAAEALRLVLDQRAVDFARI